MVSNGKNGISREGHANLSPDELLRYSRQLILPEIGIDGQRRLKSASVLLIGAGGLGSPLGLYLAAAGIGKLGIVDFDLVDATNLHRQVLYANSDVGRFKVDAARERMQRMNPGVKTAPHNIRLTSENALSILREYDVIVDGTDNFPTRYLVNDACVLLGKPLVYGSVFRFDGQVTVFNADAGPCYRCLYPTPPPPGLVPDCAEGGVLGVLPGIIGSLQAVETIKLILHAGDSLAGRLVLFDALSLSFREVKVRKDPACPVCGNHPTIHELIDYDQFCSGAVERAEAPSTDDSRITVEELKSRLDRGDPVLLLDVREDVEREICSLGGHFIPLGKLSVLVNEIDSSKEIVVYCKSGARSAKAVEIIRRAGFPRVKNLVGGLDAWARRIDPSMPIY
jgi:sulfur-carrier protein adenylyltransferase/sulfurtransferase